MITIEHQRLIKDAVLSGDHRMITDSFRKVIREELSTMSNINNNLYNCLCDTIEKLEVPYDVMITGTSVNTTDIMKFQNNKYLEHVIRFAILLFVCVSSIFCGILGFLAVIGSCGFIYWYKAKKNENSKNDKNVPTVVKVFDEFTIIQLANSITLNIGQLIQGSTTTTGTETKELPLHQSYPNILKFMQTIYSDSQDFEEDVKKYLVKRIDSVVRQSYYKIETYNGKNENMFEINVENDINEPVTIIPAITYEKTGQVVLPGVISVPKK